MSAIPLLGGRGRTPSPSPASAAPRLRLGGDVRGGPRIRLLGAIAVVALLVALAACGSGDGEGSAGADAGEAAEVVAFFSDEEGRLVAERRRGEPGERPLAAAMRALAEGPDDPALVPALPAGTRVLGTGASGGLATVDLSADFEEGYPAGGSAAELAVVGPIAHTAAAVPGVERVRVTVEGRAPAPPGAQVDLAEPISPADFPMERAPTP